VKPNSRSSKSKNKNIEIENNSVAKTEDQENDLKEEEK